MIPLYILNLKSWDCMMQGSVRYDRVGKTPLVRVSVRYDNVPAMWQLLSVFLWNISFWFRVRAEGYQNCIEILTNRAPWCWWRKRADGLFEPYDPEVDYAFPYLARRQPPEGARILP